MTEWKLFSGSQARFSALGFFAGHPWIPPGAQAGHAQRMAMVVSLVRRVLAEYAPATLSDLGCGDGSLIGQLRGLPVRAWGYDAGWDNVGHARAMGLDVRLGDILSDRLEYGELITCCEVAEHLAAPHAFLASLPGRMLIVSSPSAETGSWHYVHHAWAWDLDGYAGLVRGAGWEIMTQEECDGGLNTHDGVTCPQRFQAIFARRP